MNLSRRVNTKKELPKKASQDESRDAFEEIDFGREFQDYLDPGYKTQEIEYKEDAPTFEQFLTRPPSLAEHLEWQLHMSSIPGELVDPAICVVGNLNADGRLARDERRDGGDGEGFRRGG